MRAYSIFDAAVKTFGQPMFFHTDAGATRVFMMEIRRNESGNLLNASRQDFDLYYVGVFDTETGVFTSNPAPEIILHGRSVADADPA